MVKVLLCKWFLYAVMANILRTSLCEQLFDFTPVFNHGADPCDSSQCNCYSWVFPTLNKSESLENRLTVNCTTSTGMIWGIFKAERIPNNLPANTTDLIVSGYHLGGLGVEPDILHSPLPLNPSLFTARFPDCRITFLSSDFILANSDIRVIDLSNNFLKVIEEDTFSGLPHVEVISIANNILENVRNSAFKNLPKIARIDLANNFVREIQSKSFINIRKLEYLDLSNNWLTNFPWADLSQLPYLTKLGLEGNHWNCSCDMSNILNINHSLLAGANATCMYPESLKGTLLKQLTLHNFKHCLVKSDSYIMQILQVLILPVVVLVIFSYKYNFPHGKIEYDRNKLLGKSQNVFLGKIQDRRGPVAVKRSPIISSWGQKELNILLHVSEKDSHPNVIRYLGTDSDLMYRYIALDLCEGDLGSAVIDSYEEFSADLKPERCFFQLACGMNYLHKLKIAHRDIKPQNILLKKIAADEVRFVISDFDSGHFCEEESRHGVQFGTLGWTAPELWEAGERKISVDIFSLGCVFYFVMTRGGHPFGVITDLNKCQKSIISHEYSFNGLSDCCNDCPHMEFLARDLITEMISKVPADRPKASDITNHPLLWSSEEMLRFFHKIGDCVKDKTDTSMIAFKKMLEDGAATVFDGSWMVKLDKTIQGDCKGFKKHAGEVCGLLRVIRNKIEHFENLGPERRNILLGSHEGVVKYFVSRFPVLFLHTYHTVIKSGLKDKLIKVKLP